MDRSQYEVKITKATDDFYLVQLTFPNGWEQQQRCDNEDQARVYQRGLIDGINAVKNMIGIGPHCNTTVVEHKP